MTTAAPAHVTASATTCAAAACAAPMMTAVLVVVIATGQQNGTHARNRPGPGQQGRRRFPRALAAAGHPRRDQPGHDGAEKEVPLHCARPENFLSCPTLGAI